MNDDSKSTWKGVLPWLVRWACAVKRHFCSALVALVGPAQNIFSSPYIISILFFPIAQQAWQPAVLGRPSLSMCLWIEGKVSNILVMMFAYRSACYLVFGWNIGASMCKMWRRLAQWGQRLEGWPNTAARLPGWRRVTKQAVILYVLDSPCRLPWRTIPLARPRSGAALLSCKRLAIQAAAAAGLLLNVHKIPTW